MTRLLPIAVLLFLSLAAPAAAGEAVTLQLNAQHTGAATEPGLDPPLRRAWTRRFRRPVSYPLIAGGRVFVTVASGRPYENGGSRVVALSGASGRVLWTREVGGTYQHSAAAYDAGRVYVLNDDLDLAAFAASSGALLWRRDFGLGVSTGAPVAIGGEVFAVAGGSVVAVSGATGDVVWRAPINGTDDSSPVVTADRVYASFVGPQVYAFDRRTGAEVWHPYSPRHGGGADTPALYGGRLWVRDWASVPHGYMYDAQTGAEVGRFHSDADPAFAFGRAFVLDARRADEPIDMGGVLIAHDAVPGGRVHWRFRGDGELQSAPLVVNRTVYVGSGTGRLYALDTASGRRRWQTHLPESVSGPAFAGTPRAMAAGGGLLVVPATRRLVAFR